MTATIGGKQYATMADVAVVHLLRQRIQESGLSNRSFAEHYMVRDESTIRRWLAGSTVPNVVRRWLTNPPGTWPPSKL